MRRRQVAVDVFVLSTDLELLCGNMCDRAERSAGHGARGK